MQNLKSGVATLLHEDWRRAAFAGALAEELRARLPAPPAGPMWLHGASLWARRPGPRAVLVEIRPEMMLLWQRRLVVLHRPGPSEDRHRVDLLGRAVTQAGGVWSLTPDIVAARRFLATLGMRELVDPPPLPAAHAPAAG